MSVELERWRPIVDETIERLFPRTVTPECFEQWFGPAAYGYDYEAIQRGFVDPVWELLDRGGSRLRAALFLDLLEGFGLEPTDYLAYATVPVLLHKGALIVDDIEDDADMRRHGPPIHEQFGIDVAINAGNFLYFFPQCVLLSDPTDLGPSLGNELLADVTIEMNHLHLGQTIDIDWQDRSGEDVDLDSYRQTCACKTGCLFRLATRLASTIADQPDRNRQRLLRATEELAIAYQMTDDRLDVYHSLYRAEEFGKAWGNDIIEGKITPLSIHAMAVADETDRRELGRILTAERPTTEEIEAALEMLEETGALEFARERAAEHAARAKSAFRAVEDLDAETTARLEAFVDTIVAQG